MFYSQFLNSNLYYFIVYLEIITPAQDLIIFKVFIPHGEQILKYNKYCIINLFIFFNLANRALWDF